ncbi:type II toxin-antitoxin system RelE/ParE family toxin [Bacillus pumilus]|uniref:type II toxin-antitoxin system RelE/ParE family toxin n=1 Tax=Bacillus pumilus TaxID=1408 RepID=UPI00387968AC
MDIHFYADSRGRQPVLDWLEHVKKQDKPTYNKAYIMLTYLTQNSHLILSGEVSRKDIKKLKGTDIWQLRINENRLLYFYASGNSLVFTNQFKKKQNDTPQNEIERAVNRMKTWAKEKN